MLSKLFWEGTKSISYEGRSVSLTNKILNPSFEPSMSNWSYSSPIALVTSGGASGSNCASVVAGSTSSHRELRQSISLTQGRKYYAAGSFKRAGSITHAAEFDILGGGLPNEVDISHLNNSSLPSENTWYRKSLVFTAAASGSSINFRVYSFTPSPTQILCDAFILIDLTEAFGAGKEPVTTEAVEAILTGKVKSLKGKVKVNGQWITPYRPNVRVNGQWVNSKMTSYRVNGVWKNDGDNLEVKNIVTEYDNNRVVFNNDMGSGMNGLTIDTKTPSALNCRSTATDYIPQMILQGYSNAKVVKLTFTTNALKVSSYDRAVGIRVFYNNSSRIFVLSAFEDRIYYSWNRVNNGLSVYANTDHINSDSHVRTTENRYATKTGKDGGSKYKVELNVNTRTVEIALVDGSWSHKVPLPSDFNNFNVMNVQLTGWYSDSNKLYNELNSLEIDI